MADHPVMQDVPIGLHAQGQRREFDSMGDVRVPADRYWGAQTERSLHHFSIGNNRMPKEVYHAYGTVKKACALVNAAEGRLPQWKADAIVRAADETIAGHLDDHYPLYVWQTGSGTQSNMNVNEVLSNRAIQLLGGSLGSQQPVAPNDDVNMGQSSNDTFPTAMHVAALAEIDGRLLPQVEALAKEIEVKAEDWMGVVKIGRTHLEDAVPLTVGQEWSGYAAQLRACIAEIVHSRTGLLELAVGGTAVGTGLNAPAGFSAKVAAKIAELTGKPFVTAPNKFMAQGSLDAMVQASAARAGGGGDEDRQRHALARLRPALRPGRTAAAGQRAGQLHHARQGEPDAVRGHRAGRHPGDRRRRGGCLRRHPRGSFELNAMRPVITNNFLQPARILGDGCEKFRLYSVEGSKLRETRIAHCVEECVMPVTALSPVIGYEKAAHIAQKATRDGSTLTVAALAVRRRGRGGLRPGRGPQGHGRTRRRWRLTVATGASA